MYAVKVTISAKDPLNPKAKYKSKTHNGIYIPKAKTTSVVKIEQETRAYFDKILKPHNPNLEISYQITVKKIKCDFHIADE